MVDQGQISKNPNIIFLMADDMGYGDLSCYGAKKIHTPNIDKLASEGISFNDAHAPSAVCTPTRYGVLTGRYCWRTRLKEWVLWDGYEKPLIEQERLTIASLLKEHNYITSCIGKWHIGLDWAEKENGEIDYYSPIKGGPIDLGFDYFFGMAASLDMPPYCFIENNHTVGTPSVEKNPYNPMQREGLMVPGWKDEQVGPTFTAKAIEFIKNQVSTNPKKPFFLYMPTSAPHSPHVPPDFIKGKSDAGCRGDMVVEVDWTVGQIMNTLDELGISDNTLFIVTSDNGAKDMFIVNSEGEEKRYYSGKDYNHDSNGILRGQKADIWDGGHRIPFIARWPGKIKPGTISSEMICLTDLIRTIAAIVETDLPENAGEDSFNILPALLNNDLNKHCREAVVHHSGAGHFALRKGAWKMITKLGSGGFTEPREVKPESGDPAGQLYNLKEDIKETNNLWNARPEIVKSLSKMLEKYKELGRSYNIDTRVEDN